MYSPSVSRIGALVLASRPAVSGPALSSALPLGPRYNRESAPEPTKVSSASSAAVTSKTADPETRANTTQVKRPHAGHVRGVRGIDRTTVKQLPFSALVGTVLGSSVWGALEDLYGRRVAILLSAVMYIGTSICGANAVVVG